MTQVFISYSRRDLAFVEQLAADLKAAGLDVWYDLSNLQGGARWSRAIEKAIRDSQYVLVVLSPDSVASKWVEEEFLYASELGKKIIPLFYKRCALPFGFRTMHFIDIQGDKYKQKFNEILRALGTIPIIPKEHPKLEEVEPVPAKSEKEEISSKPKVESKQRKWVTPVIIVVALIGVVLAGIFGFPALQSQPENTPQPTQILTKQTEQVPTSARTLTASPEPNITPSKTPIVLATATDYTGTLPLEITDAKGVSMRLVPAGKFIMGQENGYKPPPAHIVFLDAFYMDKYEVSNAAYQKCVTAGICLPPYDFYWQYPKNIYYENPKYSNYPMLNLDWDMARVFCEWRDARLPTEAEWEKAARGTDKRMYPWGNDFNGYVLNFCDKNCEHVNDSLTGKDYDDGYSLAAPVNSFPEGVSPYGIYNMAGNVQEWVADWWSEAYYEDSPTSNPLGPSNGESKVVRGGTWDSASTRSIVTQRNWAPPANPGYRTGIGFRCAKGVTLTP